ncbi:MAG: thiamine biosynthesis protein ThiJ, partial [Marivirga sp.]|nr:thiamine biosynthesis protein ThiJ [Marivirga sp.]
KGNEAYKTFLQKQSYRTKFVASVSLGALLLADSGILNGYQVTTSTGSLPVLFEMGLMAVEARIVVDRNRIAGDDRTSAADISLVLSALMELEEKARIEKDRK